MPFIKEMPKTKGKGHCDKHGKYEFRYQDCFGGSIMVSEYCEACAKEEKEKAKLEEIEKANAQKQKLMISERVKCGVSKRNANVNFDSFTCSTTAQGKAKESVLRWISKFNADKNSTPSMMITGKVGTGKTLLASCIINELILHPYDLPYSNHTHRRTGNKYKIIKLVDMVRSLKETWNRSSEKTERDLISEYSNLDLLIIDEVGMGFESDTEKLFVFDVIDGRYQNELPTILISNLNAEGIKNSIGERAVDRLRDGGGVLVGCDWESFRK